MSRDHLAVLGQRLDERQHVLASLDAYYGGRQPLTYLSPEAKERLGSRLQQVSVNIPRLIVASLAERLRVVGFHRGGAPDAGIWAAWLRSGLDQTSGIAHRESLALGASYAVVWAGRDGAPQVSIESPRQVTVQRDPATREVLSALKRWDVGIGQRAVVFEPDRITKYATDAAGAPTTSGAWRVVETISNPLGVVPVAALVNTERLLEAEGRSEFEDAIPLTDALVKIITDMMVTSESYARPRRWATGIELEEDADGNAVNPFPEGDTMMTSEAPEAKIGQLPSTDLGSYENATTVVLKALSAVTALPEHVLGVGSDNPSSADAIRASEAALTAKAEAKAKLFGRAWEQVGRLMVAVRDGVDPASVDVAVKWADPSTRSVAQEADAVVKLVTAGILPVTEALSRLGYSDADVTRIRSARRAQALDGAGIDLLRGLGR